MVPLSAWLHEMALPRSALIRLALLEYMRQQPGERPDS